MAFTGFSMLQGGPLPYFSKEEQLQRLLGLGTYTLSEAEQQFQAGLAKFGLVEVRLLESSFELIHYKWVFIL